MLLGDIHDDFAGPSDLANALAKGGMTTVQFIGCPKLARSLSARPGSLP
jgi:uncharacterized protein YgbK (DUF1537 family)